MNNLNDPDKFNDLYLAGRAVAKLQGIEVERRWPKWDHALHMECMKAALNSLPHYDLMREAMDVCKEAFRRGDMNLLHNELFDLLKDTTLTFDAKTAFANGCCDECSCIRDHIYNLAA